MGVDVLMASATASRALRRVLKFTLSPSYRILKPEAR